MDMIYVGDLAEVLIRALVLNHGCYDSVIEAGRGRELTPTINQLVDNVVAQVGQTSCTVRHVTMRGGEPERSVVVGDPRTLAPLGLAVGDMLSLDDGIARTIRWYRKHIQEFA
jgi:nucleoside-diphosphate-sugar epimerase